MTPLTAEKIDHWEPMWTPNPKTGRNEFDGMMVCPGGDYVLRTDYGALHAAYLSLAKRVAGAPVGSCPVYAPDGNVGAASIWFDGAIAADRISGKRVALVEIVGGEEG